ncbi:hypothetical protein EH165_05505 [Nakamurella antarctica]|uniref:DUF7455 domain-containing protein n=1 Tax=Nakamurella antarctica TaxID=1902245 RepID=A0A3G8ZK26_9ACTN|nr:hypothetical protein [Nakamurella antarctica]AZI57689.1 hypothetical protein EH165_05505 [Nakamurella antarctica]
MTGSVASPLALTATDRCDRCGAAASARAVMASGGELLFCGHHAREYSTKLEQLAAQIHLSEKENVAVATSVNSGF